MPKLTKLNGGIVSVTAKSKIDWNEKSASNVQWQIKQFLYQFWKNDVVVEEFYIPGSKLRLDFFNFSKKICVECSPDKVHTQFNKFFHKNRLNFLDKIKKDEAKRLWCEKNEIEFLELTDEDIKDLEIYFADKLL